MEFSRSRPGAGQRVGLSGSRGTHRGGLDLAAATPGRHRRGDFYDGKRAAAAYFIAYELPKTGPQLDLLDALDRTTLELDPAWL